MFAPNQDVAFMLSILWTTIQLLLSGFFVNFPEVMNYWITYLRYISAAYYRRVTKRACRGRRV